jgi:type III restriction enzyme
VERRLEPIGSPSDEASGASTGGNLYLTNIHRLYDAKKRRTRDPETYEWMGPTVSKQKALDTGKELRERITSHEKVMVLNDEAHHIWDPNSAWNEAITYLHDTINSKTGGGLVAQLDFTATPKDDKARIFQHVVVDTPLGEAVDCGIVKTPIIGMGSDLAERPSRDASEKYEQHLLMGYHRWLKSKEEWQGSGKKPLLFVMTEDTEAADQITRRLNSDPLFEELNSKTINLHTNLKGKIKYIGKKGKGYPIFVESEKEISDEDLAALRELSRDLDSSTSPYQCIVSVLMLREGWDVKNVTTIVPLRPYTSKANILPEQTLGRGLRRMTPATSGTAELVTVVEHKAFVSLYRDELGKEGVPVEVTDPEGIPATTVTIYPDLRNKDVDTFDISLPKVSDGFTRTKTLENLTFEDVEEQFKNYDKLPLGEVKTGTIDYEGRHLITNEIVERMEISIPLLKDGFGAISFFHRELETIANFRGTFRILAPLIQKFIEESLFEERVTLFDTRLLSRIGDPDVREYIRATFVPLILQRTTERRDRRFSGEGLAISKWKPYQVTHSVNKQALPASRTLFNLVPCDRELERVMKDYLDNADDVVAFYKNDGPQALRIDYLSEKGRLSLYTPDFIVRLTDGDYFVVETKGREDRDVPLKARAAIAWCEAASSEKNTWQYVYVPQGVFERVTQNNLRTLARMCETSLKDLIEETPEPQLALPFSSEEYTDEEQQIRNFIDLELFEELSKRSKVAVRQAVTLYYFLQSKEGFTFGSAFNPLLGPLDDSARAIIVKLLESEIPESRVKQKEFFYPELHYSISRGQAKFYERQASNLERTLLYGNGLMPIGLLKWCLEFANEPDDRLTGIFRIVAQKFSIFSESELLKTIDEIYSFRNQYIAHQDQQLLDVELARDNLCMWVQGLFKLQKV